MPNMDSTSPITNSTPPANNPGSTAKRAGLGSRLMAIVYDSFICLALVLIAALLIEGLMVVIGVAANPSQGLHDSNYSQHPLYLLSLVLVIFSYFMGLWMWHGQTVGMRAWRLRLVNRQGGRPSMAQCTKRFLAALLAFACLGLGYLWQLWQKDSRSWPDLLSDTDLNQEAKG